MITPRLDKRALRAYVLAVAVTAVAMLITLSVPVIRERSPLILPITAIAVSAWYGGLWPGLIATFIATLVFIPVFLAGLPPDPFLESAEAFRLILFVVSGALVSALGEGRLRAEMNARDAEAEAEVAAKRAERLQEVTAALSEVLSADDVLRIIVERGLPAIGASAGGVSLVTDHGTALETVRRFGYRPDEPAPRTIPVDKAGVFTEVFETKQPIFFTSQADLARRYPNLASAPPHSADGALVIVPLLAEGRPIGALAARFKEARVFDDTDRAYVLGLAQQCAQALERARLYEAETTARRRAEEAQQRVDFVARVSTVLSGPLDYQTRLERLAQVVIPYLADGCMVQCPGGRGFVELSSAAHFVPAKLNAMRRLEYLPMRETDGYRAFIAQLSAGRSVLFSDFSDAVVASLTERPDDLDALAALGAKSVMVVPIMTGRGFDGIIVLLSTESERRYTADDLSVAEEVARRAAVALDNARLFDLEREAHRAAERAAHRVSRLQSATAALSSAVTPDQVADVIIREGQIALGAQGAHLVLVDEDGRTLDLVRTTGYPGELMDQWQHIPIDMPVPMADAVRWQEILTVSSPEEATHLYPQLVWSQSGFQSWASAPLIAGGKVFGAVEFSFDKRHVFDQDEITYLSTLAEQSAQALERARLYEAERQARARSEEARRRLDFLAGISAILSGSLDYDTWLNNLAHSVLPYLADGCIVSLPGPNGTVITAAVAHVDPIKEAKSRALQREQPVENDASRAMGEILLQGKTVLIERIDTSFLQGMFEDPDELKSALEITARSAMYVPLVTHDGVSGMITFYTTEGERYYTQDDVILAEEVARRAAIALDNARLFEAERTAHQSANRAVRQMSRMQATTAALSSAVTSDEVLDVIIHEGLDTMDAQGGTLSLVTANRRDMELVRTEGYVAHYLDNWHLFPIDTPTPITEATRSGQVIVLQSREEARERYPAFHWSDTNHHAWAVAPLIAGDQALGALGFSFIVPRTFTDEDLRLLRTLGEQSGQALERARLYGAEQDARARAEEARRRVDFVASVSAALAGPLEVETRLDTVAHMVVPFMADGCVIRFPAEHGDAESLAVVHVDPAKEQILRTLQRLHTTGEGPGTPGVRAMQEALNEGRPLLLAEVDAETRQEFTETEEDLRLAQALGAKSLMTVPLLTRVGTGATISFYITESDRHYTLQDLALAEEVARRVAVRVDNARLFERERQAHAAAEQAARRVARLQTVTASLSKAVTPDEVADVIIHEGLDTLGAAGGTLTLLTPDRTEFELVRAEGYPDHVMDTWRRFRTDAHAPTPEVVRARQIMTLESPEAALARYPELGNSHGGFKAWAIVPLVVGGRAIGALDFAFSEPRTFSADELAFLTTLGEQSAQALERAQLYEAEQRSRTDADARARRISLLYEVSNRLADTLDLTTMLNTLARLTAPALADWVVIELLASGRWGDQFAVAHYDRPMEELAREMRRRYPSDLHEVERVKSALEAGEVVFIPDMPPEMITAGAQDAEHAEMLRTLNATSYMVLPLLARGQLLGGIALLMTNGRRFDNEDLAVARELARRAAVFLDNARLYREARDAVAARQAILAVVSHDLKNPLAVIKGYSALLETALRSQHGLPPERLIERVKKIDNVTMRMNSMINELVDFSRIQAGQPLDIQTEPIDLVPLTRQVVEEQRQTTKRHQITLAIETPNLRSTVDTVKIERVLSNIIGNAIKYSPEGSRIEVSVRRETRNGSDCAAIEVRDDGVGIPAEDLPHIFQFFHRGSNIEGHFRGTGIGLATAQHIVQQHGGTIEVTSEVGVGSTFTVVLPLRANGAPANAAAAGSQSGNQTSVVPARRD
ncbi:MAG: GAF domain-containing protein [Anaerolineae bacterium]